MNPFPFSSAGRDSDPILPVTSGTLPLAEQRRPTAVIRTHRGQSEAVVFAAVPKLQNWQELINGYFHCEKRERIRRRSNKNKFGEIDRRQGGDVILRSIY
jgi:hypothetical protein